ncbi:melatonin receptor type 1B-B-like [Homalodisca vitripennis]|uniref:melatonin receptor type 1B-B-like n=1 Tax=Homalodisca vitripennis TaxID=197043 RepID=UPI001EEBE87E|nr:melatonin receptor type 1B-B-like [Homalodisca vitripennis]
MTSNVTVGGLEKVSGVSPVTLSEDWSRVARLLVIVCLAVIGSVGNVYMISAIMIEDHLKKRGNTFMANVALADLLVTGVVMPASAVVILAGIKDSPLSAVCSLQWCLSIVCWLVTILSLLATAGENYARLCLSPHCYASLTQGRITLLMLAIWAVSGVMVALQFHLDLVPDYCSTKSTSILPYQATAAVLCLVLPGLVTLALYLRIILQVRLARANPSFKPPIAFNWDYSLMKTNLYSFFLFFLFWLPFGIVLCLASRKKTSALVFYNLAWLALGKSCVNNILYCVCNRHFRNAYINLFHYCCCKTTVTFSRRSRAEAVRPTGDVRVHIIPGYNMYSYTSPQRAGREASKSPGKRSNAGRTRPNCRDVYEL